MKTRYINVLLAGMSLMGALKGTESLRMEITHHSGSQEPSARLCKSSRRSPDYISWWGRMGIACAVHSFSQPSIAHPYNPLYSQGLISGCMATGLLASAALDLVTGAFDILQDASDVAKESGIYAGLGTVTHGVSRATASVWPGVIWCAFMGGITKWGLDTCFAR